MSRSIGRKLVRNDIQNGVWLTSALYTVSGWAAMSSARESSPM